MPTVLLAIISCKKETTVEDPSPINKWEVISGDYSVYDTNGVHLYNMSIAHSYNAQLQHDSLHFANLNNSLNFSAKQTNGQSASDMSVFIGYHDTLYDISGYRWTLLVAFDEIYDNTLQNDTLKMIYRKTNINYYLSDFTQYADTVIREIAIKQN